MNNLHPVFYMFIPQTPLIKDQMTKQENNIQLVHKNRSVNKLTNPYDYFNKN